MASIESAFSWVVRVELVSPADHFLLHMINFRGILRQMHWIWGHILRSIRYFISWPESLSGKAMRDRITFCLNLWCSYLNIQAILTFWRVWRPLSSPRKKKSRTPLLFMECISLKTSATQYAIYLWYINKVESRKIKKEKLLSGHLILVCFSLWI